MIAESIATLVEDYELEMPETMDEKALSKVMEKAREKRAAAARKRLDKAAAKDLRKHTSARQAAAAQEVFEDVAPMEFDVPKPKMRAARVDRSHCTKFVFVIGAGASAEAPARIPTFRGSAETTKAGRVAGAYERESYAAAAIATTRPLVKAAVDAGKRFYPKKEMFSEHGIDVDTLPWTAIYNFDMLQSAPRVIEAVAREWVRSIAGRPPNLIHRAMKDLEDKKLLQRVITMNVDNLEYAAGIDRDNVVLVHGSAFVGRTRMRGGNIIGVHSVQEIPDDFTTSIVTVEGIATPDDDIIAETLLPDMKDSCLVFVGVSGSIVPEFVLRKAKPKRLIIVNDREVGVSNILEAFEDAKNHQSHSIVETFGSIKEFVEHYVPGVPATVPVAQLPLNNSEEAVEKAVEWIRGYAGNFPLYE